jgi:hypothetical protein
MAAVSEETSKKVYTQAGVALHWAQCFEASTTNFLVFHARLTGQAITLESSDALEANFETSTMGQLVQKLKQFATFEGDTEIILKEALAQRNHLAHSFFKTHAETFVSEEGAQKMLEELKKSTMLFRKADLVAHTLSIAVAKAFGISEEQMQKEYEAIIANAEKG